MKKTSNEDASERRDKAIQMLHVAKKQEMEKFANGWRYVKVSFNTSLLVPCNSDGTPTKEGLKKIEMHKKNIE